MPTMRVTRGGRPLPAARIATDTESGVWYETNEDGRADVAFEDGQASFVRIEHGQDRVAVDPHRISATRASDGVLHVELSALPATGSGTLGSLVRPRSLVGTVLKERYQITGVLGQGGMGVVYKAVDLDLDRPVAIKVLTAELAGNEDARRIFETEARILAKVSHPNLVSVFDVVREGDDLGVVMEFIDGVPLEQMIESSNGPLPTDAAVNVALQLIAALSHLHDQGIIHRDVKPANVLVDDKGAVSLTDFGLARRLSVLAAKHTQIRGTPAYMAPEQVLGEQLTEACDVYGAAVSIFELFTGRLPFQSGEIAFKHVNEDPPRAISVLSSTPAPISDLLYEAMAKDPGARPATGRDLLRRFVAAVDGLDFVLPGIVLAELGGDTPTSLRKHISQPDPGPARRHTDGTAAPGAQTADAPAATAAVVTNPAEPVAGRSPASMALLVAVVLLMLGGSAWGLWSSGVIGADEEAAPTRTEVAEPPVSSGPDRAAVAAEPEVDDGDEEPPPVPGRDQETREPDKDSEPEQAPAARPSQTRPRVAQPASRATTPPQRAKTQRNPSAPPAALPQDLEAPPAPKTTEDEPTTATGPPAAKLEPAQTTAATTPPAESASPAASPTPRPESKVADDEKAKDKKATKPPPSQPASRESTSKEKERRAVPFGF